MPEMENGPWIIGGAALEFMQTRDFQNSRDIDYFFSSYNQFIKYVDYFGKVKGAKYDRDTEPGYRDKNCNIKIGEYTFNLIGFDFAASAKIIADSFDFTVCQVWTDGRIYECSEKTLYDIEHKILSFTDVQRKAEVFRKEVKDNVGSSTWNDINETTLKALETRIKKYRDKGFDPDEQMIEFILKYL